MMETLKALILYFEAILEDGDYMNDWITHLPQSIQTPVEMIGHALSLYVESVQYFTDMVGHVLSFYADLFQSFINLL